MNRRSFCRLLKANKVPHYAWPRFEPDQLKKNFNISPVTQVRNLKTGSIKTKQIVRIKAGVQYDTYKSLCMVDNTPPWVIGISSEPNDYLASMTASLIHYSIINRNPGTEWSWINSAFKVDGDNDLNLVIIHNIIPDYSRVYQIRDLILKFPNALRLVVISGMNALHFFDSYLKMPISGMIHLTGTKKPVNKYVSLQKDDDEVHYPVFTNEIDFIMRTLAKAVKVS